MGHWTCCHIIAQSSFQVGAVSLDNDQIVAVVNCGMDKYLIIGCSITGSEVCKDTRGYSKGSLPKRTPRTKEVNWMSTGWRKRRTYHPEKHWQRFSNDVAWRMSLSTWAGTVSTISWLKSLPANTHRFNLGYCDSSQTHTCKLVLYAVVYEQGSFVPDFLPCTWFSDCI